MKRTIQSAVILIFTLILATGLSVAQVAESKMTYTVSMDQPVNHYYHVTFRYDGVSSGSVDLKMPAWTPGYYMILDLAKNVVDFTATDESGKPLAFEKTAKNTWHINTEGVESLNISYYVFANQTSVAESYLSEQRGFISPTGIFMYVDGKLNHPVTVRINPFTEWTQISTGLDRVEGSKNTFTAPDFDRLYDCPVLTGNQEVVKFEYKGIPHDIAIETPGTCNRDTLASDLKRIVEAATGIIGEIPYKHYTFIIMERGGGGLEHLNSMAVFADVSKYQGSEHDRNMLGFFAHEFFHLYNVKSIRPIVLGPFNYDKECITNMLWLSEGGTSYFEELILNRAGFLNREKFLAHATRTIGCHENIVGHEFQSVALASRDTWMLFFNRNENSEGVTINYYEKGSTLCLLLDLRIRYESKNENSLIDVMRTLYQLYSKSLNRGFTDEEFREVCEKAAGCSLADFFEYVYTTKSIDYAKYFGYAGLNIDLTPLESVTHLNKTIYKRSFLISPVKTPSVLQKQLLDGWLK